ncbi:MAG: DNA repair exonuclease [Desulfovibrio sp.]|nr:DNA repair exonuclease [Desulfovibrio sp.]
MDIRYIHAADLHLDTPFLGLSRLAAGGGRLTKLLQEATFTALERLFRLCETDKPDFLVLAGDIYNEEHHSVKAQLRLYDGCCRLSKAGVRVFLAHGNHDPLSSRLTAVQWPDNVTTFGPEVEQHILEKNGVPAAIIHGISHESIREGRNLANLFRRNTEQACFQLGVLHCSVEGNSSTDRYAPCSLKDLQETGLDAWALGHVHEHATLCAAPFIAYSGSTQGLHINEAGPHGCLRVTVTPSPNGGFECKEEFVRLGPVQWAKVEVDLEGVEHLDDVERRCITALEAEADATAPGCEAVLARVHLCGHTPLDTDLRKATACDDLAERLTHLQTGTPGVWVTDIKAATAAVIDHKQYLEREDLLGESLRLVHTLRLDDEALHRIADNALRPLYEHGQLRKILERPDREHLHTLLQEAERLCADILEVR